MNKNLGPIIVVSKIKTDDVSPRDTGGATLQCCSVIIQSIVSNGPESTKGAFNLQFGLCVL